MHAGTFFLIVGASGVGKDTLLAGARAALAADDRFVFARRTITRPADAGGEDHLFSAPDAFARTREAGGFLSYWSAHGLDYGLPVALADLLAQGQHVPGGQAERNVLNSRAGSPRVAVALERAQTSLWGLAAWFVPFSSAAPALELPWAAPLERQKAWYEVRSSFSAPATLPACVGPFHEPAPPSRVCRSPFEPSRFPGLRSLRPSAALSPPRFWFHA